MEKECLEQFTFTASLWDELGKLKPLAFTEQFWYAIFRYNLAFEVYPELTKMHNLTSKNLVTSC